MHPKKKLTLWDQQKVDYWADVVPKVMERMEVAQQKPSYAYPVERPVAATMSPWFDDSRLIPDRTAAYLQKLNRLRDNLLQTENTNLSNAISRTIKTGQGLFPKLNQGQAGVAPRRRATFSTNEGPNRHAQMQMEKTAKIERRRRIASKTPPPLTVGVRQIEDPDKPRHPPKLKQMAKNMDPFDPSVLEPADPMDKLFNLERIRLLNALAAQKNQALNEVKNDKDRRIKPTLHHPPRRGNEWFVTGRYQQEERKAKVHKGATSRGKHHKHSKKSHGSHASPKTDSSLKSDTMSDSKSLEVESVRSDTRTEKGSIPPSTTPVVWESNQPLAIDSTANLMNAIASTAEANKADVKAKTFHYDPSNYRPIGTPKSPRASSGSNINKLRYDDLRRGKALTAALQESAEENIAFVTTAVAIRSPYEDELQLQGEQYRKGGQKTSHNDDAIKVPGLATTPSAFEQSDHKPSPASTSRKDPLEVIPNPPGTGQGKTEPLFVPASQTQPLINLRHASPDQNPKEEEVSLKKIFRQNELREKELNNLFEDIKELNKISDNLRQAEAGIDEGKSELVEDVKLSNAVSDILIVSETSAEGAEDALPE